MTISESTLVPTMDALTLDSLALDDGETGGAAAPAAAADAAVDEETAGPSQTTSWSPEARDVAMTAIYKAATHGFDYRCKTPDAKYVLDLTLADPKTAEDRKRLHDWILIWYNLGGPDANESYDDYDQMTYAAIRAGSVDGLALLFHGVYYDRNSPDFDSCLLEAAARGTPATLQMCLWALETFAQLNPSELLLGDLLAAARENPATHACLCDELLGVDTVHSFMAWTAGHCDE